MPSGGVSTAELADLLAALPFGHRLWVRGMGRCLYPLLRSGDAVRLLRCGPERLARGDVALVRHGPRLAAQVVLSTEPWVTESLLGGTDVAGGELVGRIVALKRGRWVMRLPRPTRPALFLLQRTLSGVWTQPASRAVFRHLRDLFSGWTKPLRRQFVGPLEIRLVRPDDLDPLLAFATERLVVSGTFLRRQLRDRWGLPQDRRVGAAAGAFDAQGHLLGFAWADDYHQEGLSLEGFWVRSLVVSPKVRRMGVATALVRCLVEEIHRQGADRLHADIDEDNTASLRTFSGLGFRPAPDALTVATNQQWDAAGGSKRLVVLVRPLPA
ncbi:GNAT family N-acetyltransferase [Corallococcus exiguus]|uniref:GNAT family N-acetyltransferase n=1 Tax=Corallococcus exiguus TaxID=83462 RepID=UPI003DA554FC